MTNYTMQDDPFETIKATFEHLHLTTTHSQRLDWIEAAVSRIPHGRTYVADTADFNDIFNSGCEWITINDQPYIYPMIVFAAALNQLMTGAPIEQSIKV
ncbi:unnamed protein product [marine sediment metagenome]|uniref:Uncharacterized protein n=1 Tax=marine sediment metagenome TaxID=412755 RepID=X1IKC1_9ZZZZ